MRARITIFSIILMLLFNSCSFIESKKENELNTVDHYSTLAYECIAGNEIDKALMYAQRAFELDDTSIEVHLLLRSIYLKQRKYGKAVEVNRNFNKLYPENAASYIILGESLCFNEQFDEALSLFDRAVEIDHSLVNDSIYLNTYWEAAGQYYGTGRFDKVISAYDRLLKIQPSYAKAYLWKIDAYYRLEDDVNVINAYEKAMQYGLDYTLDLRTESLFIEVAQVYTVNGQYDKAVALIQELLKSEHDSFVEYYLLVGAYCGMNRYNKALEYAKKAINLYPRVGAAYFMLGDAYSRLGDRSKAMINFNKAVELEPDNMFAHHGIGLMCYEEMKYQKALEHLNKIFITEDSYLTELLLAAIYEALGEQTKADELINKVLSSHASNDDVYTNLGWFKLLNRKFNEALTILQKGKDVNLESVALNIAHVYLVKKEYAKAKEIYVKYIDYKKNVILGDLELLEKRGLGNKGFAEIKKLL